MTTPPQPESGWVRYSPFPRFERGMGRERLTVPNDLSDPTPHDQSRQGGDHGLKFQTR